MKKITKLFAILEDFPDQDREGITTMISSVGITSFPVCAVFSDNAKLGPEALEAMAQQLIDGNPNPNPNAAYRLVEFSNRKDLKVFGKNG